MVEKNDKTFVGLSGTNSENSIALGSLQTAKTADFQLSDFERYIDLSLVDMNNTNLIDYDCIEKTHETKYEPFIDHLFKYPNLENVDSDYNFEVQIDGANKNNWMYHSAMKKAYIKIYSVMNVNILFTPLTPCNDLHVRAMVVYASADDMHLPAVRCNNHNAPNDKNNDVPRSHILKCHHPNTKYVGCENKQIFGERLSLIVPLSMAQFTGEKTCSESIGLEFLCQNSCASGINRKPAAIVFTLENSNMEILGKTNIHFKVCSAPKRDMARDERESEKLKINKRPVNDVAVSKRPSKMIKIEHKNAIKMESSDSGDGGAPSTPLSNQTVHSDDQPVTITFTMPTRKSMSHVLQCAYNEVIGACERNKNVDKAQYLKYARKIEQFREIYSDP